MGTDPLTLSRLAGACPKQADRILELAEVDAGPAERDRCRGELTRHWCIELLRAKAPPLYDALPWFEPDIAPLLGGFHLWRTRLMLAGDGAPALLLRFPRTAGVTVVEPVEPIARYAEERIRIERIRNAAVVRSPLEELSDSAGPFDLALVGLPLFAEPEPALERLCVIARTVVLLEFGPDGRPPATSLLGRLGFRSQPVRRHAGPTATAHVRRA